MVSAIAFFSCFNSSSSQCAMTNASRFRRPSTARAAPSVPALGRCGSCGAGGAGGAGHAASSPRWMPKGFSESSRHPEGAERVRVGGTKGVSSVWGTEIYNILLPHGARSFSDYQERSFSRAVTRDMSPASASGAQFSIGQYSLAEPQM